MTHKPGCNPNECCDCCTGCPQCRPHDDDPED